MLAMLGVASRASAILITGGPTYSPPNGGNCTLSGDAKLAGGATWTCSVPGGAYSNLYIGIKNNNIPAGTVPIGEAMRQNNQPTGAEIFSWSAEGVATITYTGQTSVFNALTGTSTTAYTRLTLTFTGAGSVIDDATTQALSNANGAVHSLWRTTATSFTVNALLEASDAPGGPWTPARTYFGTTTVHGKNTRNGVDIDVSHVDIGFYYSTCGDSTVDANFGAEQCDQGGANGSPASCCTSTCQLRPAGEVCRGGGGAPCDLSETCTGLSPICPIDDAPLNSGIVCRAGSGDVCDQNETCTGVPGAACPPDDAPGNVGLICRLSTTGDICDEDEVCPGAPGATCPLDDAPSKINVVCRAGSGDICDPDERCAGIAGQGCPPDVVANPTTVCRTGSGDGCDPNETCTAVPGQPCPANVVTPAGTVCRPVAGACDVAEQCSGNAGQACPANGFAVAQTPCNQDASVCTVDKCDGSGNCTFVSNLDCNDGNSCTQDACDPIDGCEYSGTPATTCMYASRALLMYKDFATNTSDSVKFRWKGGPSLIADMGDPTQTTRYELCVYDNRGVQMAMGVPPGSGWETIGLPSSPKGYRYRDSSALSGGVRQIKTKASSLDRARMTLSGKGNALPDTATLPFQFPITAQLYASDGMCWEAQFDQTKTRKNDDKGFAGKTP